MEKCIVPVREVKWQISSEKERGFIKRKAGVSFSHFIINIVLNYFVSFSLIVYIAHT